MPSNALDYITIKGFKSIASIEKLALRPINVVIGANGSGKSNFIGVFAFLHAIQDRKLRDYVTVAGGAEKVLHFGSKVTNQISFILFLANGGSYGVQLLPASDDSLSPAVETLQARGGAVNPPGQLRQDPTKWMRDQVGSWRIYHVHDTSSTSPM